METQVSFGKNWFQPLKPQWTSSLTSDSSMICPYQRCQNLQVYSIMLHLYPQLRYILIFRKCPVVKIQIFGLHILNVLCALLTHHLGNCVGWIFISPISPRFSYSCIMTCCEWRLAICFLQQMQSETPRSIKPGLLLLIFNLSRNFSKVFSFNCIYIYFRVCLCVCGIVYLDGSVGSVGWSP